MNMKGTSLKMALSCALKVKKGQKCSNEELRASLDTLAYSYKKAKPSLKRVARRTRKAIRKYPTKRR